MLDAAGLTGLTLLSLDDVAPFEEAPETGATFEENALVKARDAYTATSLPAVADDSGLEVAALNGMPGVLSARWSGRHGDDVANYELLLAQTNDVPDGGARRPSSRRARAGLRAADGDHVVVRGEWPGVLAREPRGDGGFGYDPIFIPEGSAQRRPADRSGEDAASHRGRALASLVPALRELA